MASWVSRTPSIRDALGASTFEMGLIVFALAVGSIVGLTFSSHLLARIGSAATIRTCLVAMGFGMILTGIGATMTTSALVVTGLAIFGLYTVVDFNRLRRAGTDEAIPLAAGIFLDVLNIFLLFLRLFARSN